MGNVSVGGLFFGEKWFGGFEVFSLVVGNRFGIWLRIRTSQTRRQLFFVLNVCPERAGVVVFVTIFTIMGVTYFLGEKWLLDRKLSMTFKDPGFVEISSRGSSGLFLFLQKLKLTSKKGVKIHQELPRMMIFTIDFPMRMIFEPKNWKWPSKAPDSDRSRWEDILPRFLRCKN